jgi:hypothetical protein
MRGMKKRKETRGRPKKPKGEKQSERVFVNMTPAELQAVTAAAKAQGFESLSSYFLALWRKES